MTGQRSVQRTPWTEDERTLLRQLIENGLSQSQAGVHLGRSKNSVHRQLATMGIVYNERADVVTAKATAARHAPKHTLPPLPSLRLDE